MQTAYGEQNLTWDTNDTATGTGGSGNWDTSSSNWFNGTDSQPWQNPAFDNAIFGGTPGTVTLTTSVNVHNITYDASDYVINGSMLILGGDGPSIIVSGPVATINSNLGGSSGFRKSGTGTLILTADNLGFSGVTMITAGTLRVDNANALGASTAASDLVLNKNSTFFFNTNFTHDFTLMGGTVSVQGGEDATWNGSPTLTLSTIMKLNGTNGTLSGNLANTGAHVLSLTRDGMGRMTLSGNNTYTGATTVTQGILQLGSANALSSGSNLVFNGVIGTGGSIELTGASGDFTRNLGTDAGQVRWVGDGGFQSSGSNRVVNIGGAGTPLTWGAAVLCLPATGSSWVLPAMPCLISRME